MKKLIAGLVIALILVAIGVAGGIYIQKQVGTVAAEEVPELSSQMIFDKLSESSELTVSKLSYNGVVEFQEGEIPWVTQKSFIMMYYAEVTAGIDLSAVTVDLSDTKVTVTLPEAQVQFYKIDSESIKFYDQSSSLFNPISNEDTVEAIKLAEQNLNENADVEELLNYTRERSEIVIYNLLSDVIEDRTIVIGWQ